MTYFSILKRGFLAFASFLVISASPSTDQTPSTSLKLMSLILAIANSLTAFNWIYFPQEANEIRKDEDVSKKCNSMKI